MDTSVLLSEIITKISRYKYLLLVPGFICAGLFFVKAKKTKPVYTAKSTIFPLINSSDNSMNASSTLSGLLGLSQSGNSFSNGGDASINIIELAFSRNVRETVASGKITALGNKTVTELLIEEYNSNTYFWQKRMHMKDDSASNAALGGQVLLSHINAKINKNGVLEMYFSSTNEALVTPVSNLLIDKISEFYVNLKVSKATFDYNFLVKKIDSLKNVLDLLDSHAIQMQQTTQFTPDGKLQYSLPKDNLSDERQMVARIRDIAINNREEALWRLQKATPIIAVLDKPNPPFDVDKPSLLIQVFTGFFIGILLVCFILCSPIFYRYIKQELSNKLVKK